MTAFRFLYLLALALAGFALFILWVLTGLVGVVAAAMLPHGLLHVCERQTDGQKAAARKAREAELVASFRR
jgi:hypothetical protein